MVQADWDYWDKKKEGKGGGRRTPVVSAPPDAPVVREERREPQPVVPPEIVSVVSPDREAPVFSGDQEPQGKSDPRRHHSPPPDVVPDPSAKPEDSVGCLVAFGLPKSLIPEVKAFERIVREPAWRYVLRTGLMDPESVVRAMGRQYGISLASNSDLERVEESRVLGHADLCHELSILPLSDGLIILSDPRAVRTIEDRAVDCDLVSGYRRGQFLLASEYRIRQILTSIFMRHRLSVDVVSDRIEGFLREGHPGGAFLWLMRYALRSQASDVHIEPRENWALVRMRVHGILEPVAILSELAVTSLINGIRNRSEQPAVANANVGKDADGAFVDPDLGIHVRVSLIPTIAKKHDVALRLLPLEDVVSRHDLGYTDDEWDRVMSVVLSAQNGIILLTGPQGSGKSTTMSGMIERTDVRGRKILEIADPVEYRTWSYTQAEVWGEGEKGWSYAAAARASLRHDSNMLKIQEIRDSETALTAIHAARTGHLVVSTLHVAGAFGVGARFEDLKIPKREIFEVLRLVVNQRLVRTLCPACRRGRPLEEEDVRGIGGIRKAVEALNVTTIYDPVGCRECVSGYVGRHPIVEIAVLDEETSDRLQADPRASAYSLARLYRECHPEYESLEQRGVRDVLEGRTSLAEILRTVGGYR